MNYFLSYVNRKKTLLKINQGG